MPKTMCEEVTKNAKNFNTVNSKFPKNPKIDNMAIITYNPSNLFKMRERVDVI